jgi:hypothetical protein
MRMAWKPDKAPGRKREQKQRLARQQKRKDFAKNMERAEKLAQELYNGTKWAINVKTDNTLGLEQKYRDWAIKKFHSRKFGGSLSKMYKDMEDTWNEILATAEACKKATDARTYPKRRAQQKLAAAKFRADRMQSRIEASQRVGAVLHAKMQEREMQAKMQAAK